VDLGTVAVATVVDDREPYVSDVECLFRSLDLFGGELRRARRRAHFVGDVSDASARRVRDAGAEVGVVPVVEPRFRFANKLAMLREAADEGAELLVALDCDIVVAGDVTPHLDSDVFQAKPPDGDLLTLELWRAIFERFGLELPRERYATSIRPGWTHAYFNTGVLLVPGPMLRPLHDRWLHFVRALIDAAPDMPAVVEHMRAKVPRYQGYESATAGETLRPLFYAEQWALSLALAELRLPYTALPLALNFPTIYEDEQRPGEYLRDRFLPHATEPLLLHHHHHKDGGLRPTGYAKPDAVIERVNAALFRRTS
jgi:hypothetical protein